MRKRAALVLALALLCDRPSRAGEAAPSDLLREGSAREEVLAALASSSARASPALIDQLAASDTDGYRHFSTRVLGAPHFESVNHVTAVGVSYLYLRQHDWSDSLRTLSLFHREVDPASAAGLTANASLARHQGALLLIGDLDYNQRLSEHAGLDWILNRSLVGSRAAIMRNVRASYFAVGWDQEWSDWSTVILMPTLRRFSDGGSQRGGKAWLIANLWPANGVALEAKALEFTGQQGSSGTYFNPQRYHRVEGGVRWRRRLLGWEVAGYADVGHEQAAGGLAKPTSQLSLTASTRLSKDAALRLTLASYRSFEVAEDGAETSEPGYAWHMARADLTVRF